ncbi:hypothetical protein OESDEN_21685 [Oesophagostomum dentatum]|uniref:Uncharacterized protein n=1 Tax=Oesophagostomum dentatum TaxID=61180 RepID=A0A0B1S5D5_OESDE|nr:hypothetical protein OESDEN_21685 [Oesophagostomum dentatum]
MAVYICVELQSINSLPEIMNCLLERSIKFTVSKDRRSLCDRCNVKEESSQSPGCSYLPQLPLVSTPSSASLDLMDSYPRSESVDSEPSDNVREELPPPTPVSEFSQVRVKEEPCDSSRNCTLSLINTVSFATHLITFF